MHKLSSETLKERDNLRYLELRGKIMNKEIRSEESDIQRTVHRDIFL
jgi:hypothetical protein